MNSPHWMLRVAASAERQLSRLPDRVAAAVVAFMVGPMCENPRTVGHLLHRELAGLWSARRGAYRVVYEIDDEANMVTVLRIEHRSDVYRPR